MGPYEAPLINISDLQTVYSHVHTWKNITHNGYILELHTTNCQQRK